SVRSVLSADTLGSGIRPVRGWADPTAAMSMEQDIGHVHHIEYRFSLLAAMCAVSRCQLRNPMAAFSSSLNGACSRNERATPPLVSRKGKPPGRVPKVYG